MSLRPLSQPSEEDVRRAREGDASARMRVRVQLLRIKKRDAEIERAKTVIANAVIADSVSADSNNLPVLSGDDDGDYGGADYDGDDCDDDRYVRISPECCNVLCCSIRTRSSVITPWFAISGLLPVRTKQHA